MCSACDTYEFYALHVRISLVTRTCNCIYVSIPDNPRTQIQKKHYILFIKRAGTPPTIVPASTSLVTTAPAAITTLSPIVTP